MILDITWCSGLRCGKRTECHRWTANLEFMAKGLGIDLTDQKISIGQFADWDGICEEMFIPLEPQDVAAIERGKGKRAAP